jgi:hypothetical protein
VGAWPTFECETLGQSEAIASNLTIMAGLRVPIVTLMVCPFLSSTRYMDRILTFSSYHR